MPRKATTSVPAAQNIIIKFYEGTGLDHSGRTLDTILGWDSKMLEQVHDFIQTLFPIPEPSGTGQESPIVDKDVFDAFRSRPELRERLKGAFRRILWFYGFELVYDNADYPTIRKGENYESNPKTWNKSFDHNHQRISRIIRCLRVLGLEAEGVAFYDALIVYSTGSCPRSREFWRRSAKRSLNLQPGLEGVEDDNIFHGPLWLRMFVKARIDAVHMDVVEKGE